MADQYGRLWSLIVSRPEAQGNNPSAYVPEANLDLSGLRFTFRTANEDAPEPTNCEVRVYNPDPADVAVLVNRKAGFSRIILQAGYEDQYGVIFDGTIKQTRTGRVNNTDTYVDLLAADGDLWHNYALLNETLSAELNTPANVRARIVASGAAYGLSTGADLVDSGVPKPRGKVLWGMARVALLTNVESQGASYSIQGGKLQVLPLDGYLPDQAVRLTSKSGLVGIPEQTDNGVRCRCLLNPKVLVGGRVQIDNASINQTQSGPGTPEFDRRGPGSLVFRARTAEDGLYRVYIAEHSGDTRGNEWFTDITGLALNPASGKVVAQ